MMKYKINNRYIIDADSPKQAIGRVEKFKDSKKLKDSYIYTEVGQDYSEIVRTLKSKGFNVTIMGNAPGYGKYIKIEGHKDKLKALQNSGYFEEETIHDSTKDSCRDAEVKLGTLKPGDRFYDRRYKEDCVLLECDDNDCRIKSLATGLVFRMSPNATVSIKDSEIDYLTQEEEQAVEDYRKAIQTTVNPKLLEIYSHILKEETEHIQELQEAKKIDNLTEDDDLVDKYQQIVDKTIELFGRIGTGLYDELDEKGLWVDDRNNKYIVKRK